MIYFYLKYGTLVAVNKLTYIKESFLLKSRKETEDEAARSHLN